MPLPADPSSLSPLWPAFARARWRDGPARVPFVLPRGAGAPARPDGFVRLGSVALADLDVAADFPDAFRIEQGHPLGGESGDDSRIGSPDGGGQSASPSAAGGPVVVLHLPRGPARDARLDEIHRALRDAGRIQAWRDERFPLRGPDGVEHGLVERAAARFWGLLTWGAHANGYLADATGRPTHLWIARRARTKPTDPGMLDTLVGGGVPAGQTPDEAIVREGWEEAGLVPEDLAGRVAGGVLEIDADIPEGRQLERLFVFDIALPARWVPRAIDGEVDEHLLMSVDEALARAAAGEMTTDAALSTLDFALRHGVAGRDAPAHALAHSLDALRVRS
jgi:8-oxo-dGTP pyrophosphatase MutT (NUDIX family)